MRDEKEQAAGVRIARLDHLPGASSLHQQRVGAEGQVALFLVRIVTAEALVAEDPDDVVVVGDLFGLVIAAADRVGVRCEENDQYQGDREAGTYFAPARGESGTGTKNRCTLSPAMISAITASRLAPANPPSAFTFPVPKLKR